MLKKLQQQWIPQHFKGKGAGLCALRIISVAKTSCITNSIQKISSIHKFVLEMQQILELQEQKSQTHF